MKTLSVVGWASRPQRRPSLYSQVLSKKLMPSVQRLINDPFRLIQAVCRAQMETAKADDRHLAVGLA
jgi:hypothetical protein